MEVAEEARPLTAAWHFYCYGGVANGCGWGLRWWWCAVHAIS